VNVAVLNLYYGGESIGTGLVAAEVAAALAEAGHRVRVVTTTADYGRLGPCTLSAGNGDAHAPGVRVSRIPVPFGIAGSRLRRSLTYGAFLLGAVPVGLRSGRAEVVLSIVPPSVAALPAFLLSRCLGARLLLDVEDLYGVNDFGGSIAARFNAWLERRMLRRADGVRVLTCEMKERVRRVAAPAGGVHVVPVWTDPEAIHDRGDGRAFRRRHGLEGMFVLLHCGNVGELGGQAPILECAEHLAAEPVRFVFVGGGYGVDRLRRTATGRGLENVLFVDRVPRAEISDMFAAGDVGVVTLDSRIRRSSTPSKTFAYMAAGLPVLAALEAGNAAAVAVTTADAGWVVPPGSAGELLAAIGRARSAAPDDRARMGRAGRAHVVASCNRRECLDRFVRLVESVGRTSARRGSGGFRK